MQTVTSYLNIPKELRGTTAVIGNFDGVHLGHQYILDIARNSAIETGSKLGVVTFEPHPREFFSPHQPAFRLMNSHSRSIAFKSLGVDVLFELEFNMRFAGLSTGEFARNVLARGLGVSHVIVGDDFRYGKKRSGDPDVLRRDGQDYGFLVTSASLSDDGNETYSSTDIRKALEDGDPIKAAQKLGYRHRIVGKVEKGDQRGRLLGFPTANLSLKRLLVPKAGVYAALVTIISSRNHETISGVASIGVRPTFGINPPNLEVYLFNFDDNLYGEDISVELVNFIRPELKFESIELLIEQMKQDCILAQKAISIHCVGHDEKFSDN